ncbi:MAG TPA: hypothetical protein RMH85_10090 [Polyangiaceae bacterium LLY-WYZ-15_(1-7)]|nr:hypothetical protein [Sandaracinus sp.]HJK92966.1 hypothetical protein [Polyangiaceae bacterium LLY-WYZ-15_(1-7)]MBJ72532.1 hypothetical protein [Sandaracinus sp.]HJL06345.1 hypothetical protein [Polyangiaceae bacterium LLY-WYZ-15_(1-7)]HJL08840.1 hypothetical protein [Polyangiaceae bacterium LLY-WYZ-15_(1-7)]
MQVWLPRAAFGAALLLSLPLAFDLASAQESRAEVSPTRGVGDYAGVRPGSANPPPRARAVQRAGSRRRPARLLTWPGFMPLPRGASRFFLQLNQPVQPQSSASEGRFEVLLPGVRTHLRNTRRPLITRYFQTPVTQAKVERRGRSDLAVVFQLRAAVTPAVSTGTQNGYHYVYVDFPAGDWLPDEPQPAPRPPSSVGVVRVR